MPRLIFRERIPEERGTATQWALLCSSLIIILIGSCYAWNSILYFWTTIALFTVLLSFVELLFRLCSIAEERKHLKTRYDGRFTELLCDVFTFSMRTCILTTLSSFLLLYVCYEHGNPVEVIYMFGYVPQMCSIVGMILASRLFNLDYGPLYQSTLISKLNGLDYGSAMAYSFFHGFLQIVLPHKGNEQKGIKELMQDFESTEGITFHIHKLLILIPLNLYCPTSLQDVSEMIELSKSLPDIKLTRAGVRDRSYMNTVYKIGRYYVCAEYATPLQTLRDIVSHNNCHANYYKKHSKDLVLQFYLTLRRILRENPDCERYCELIFFDDLDATGRRRDVAKVILNHLRLRQRSD